MRNWMLEMMQNTIVTKYGFETKETIKFCIMCELYEKGRVTKEELIDRYVKLIFK